MNAAQSQLFTTAAQWLAYGRSELIEFRHDVRTLVASARRRWTEDGSLRAHVIGQALEGLAAVVVKGPRATILWLMDVVASIVAALALNLRESRAY